jgi:hypothetical protein
MRTVPKDSDRCTFVSTDGRRCSMNRVAANASFCFNHWKRQHAQEDAAHTGDQIIPSDAGLDSLDDIHKAIGNVFRLLARKRIASRDAAVLGYLGQMMLMSLPSLERTMKSQMAMAVIANKAAHQVEKSRAADADRLHRHALQELQITQGSIELFKTLRELTPEEGARFMAFIRSFKDIPVPSPASPSEKKSA